MFEIMSKEQAAKLVKPGDVIGINCFLTLAHADVMYDAIYDRFKDEPEAAQLTILNPAGFGNWTGTDYVEKLSGAGMIKRVVASHFTSTPLTNRLISEGKIEGYTFPMGVISHWIRNYSLGEDGLLSKVGRGIYVDPLVQGAAMNANSKEQFVKHCNVMGEDYLYYHLPPIDVCLIKGTTVDPNGNITFENEFIASDSYNMAQATRRHGGKVIVQVDQVSHKFPRPRNVVIPGAIIDAVVVAERETDFDANRTLSGVIHVPPSQMNYWLNKLAPSTGSDRDLAADIIGRRGAKELKKDDIVNIGFGIPTAVCRAASEIGLLRDLHMTVESGSIGGFPAPGEEFGATIGADMIMDIAAMFDFYDGGGLDICFMGALEVDEEGNVNVHYRDGSYVGIGGFGNLTLATKNVVFCLTFNTKGLKVTETDGVVDIIREGSVPKFKKKISAISFSAKEALKRGHHILYVTERCVFELTDRGLKLIEVYPGVDKKKDILDQLEIQLAGDATALPKDEA